MSSPCKLYAWLGMPNFGDSLGKLLLAHFSDADALYVSAAESEIVVTGSVLHHLPSGWEGTVLGAGTLYADSKVPLAAEYLAVRGPLTAALTGSHDVVLGDPGLLANELVPQQPRTVDLGVIPHWSDKELRNKFLAAFTPDPKVLFINVADDPLLVIKQIASCKRIVSSSLHGIILADAYGIPRRTELTPRFAAEGGDHKFRDHDAAVGVPFRTGEWQKPLFSRVEDRQHEIYDAFRHYGTELRRQAWATQADTG